MKKLCLLRKWSLPLRIRLTVQLVVDIYFNELVDQVDVLDHSEFRPNCLQRR